jgi:hypothetical protein
VDLHTLGLDAEATLKQAGILHNDDAPDHVSVSDDVIYSLRTVATPTSPASAASTPAADIKSARPLTLSPPTTANMSVERR